MSICTIGHFNYQIQFKMNQEHRIRDYQPEDFDELNKLWKMLGMGCEKRTDDNNVIMRTIQNGGKLIVLEKEKKIIGTVWLTHDSRRSYMHHFGVHPEYQGKGYGNVLMDETVKFLREKNYQVKLEVHKDNYKALNLYRKYGFIDFSGYELMMNRNIKP